MRLLIATTNPSKLVEIRAVLRGMSIHIETAADFTINPPDETGRTFAENARLKALYYAAATGLPAVGEDSGLEIDALGGAPGVHSARFNGRTCDEKFRAIYGLLTDRRGLESPARFVCAVALAKGGEIAFEAEGRIEGRIAPSPRGTTGFGYDPIFYYPPYGRTLAEVTPKEKDAVSHRGQAFRALREYLARPGKRASHPGVRSS